MKKIITILIIAALAAALAISLVACNTGDDGGYTRPDGSFNPGGNGGFGELDTPEEIYGFSAASAGMLISAMNGDAAATAAAESTDIPADPGTGETPVDPGTGETPADPGTGTEVPSEPVVDNVTAELDGYMALVESLLSDGGFNVTTEASDREGYQVKSVVTYRDMHGNAIGYTMYYNEVLIPDDDDDDDDDRDEIEEEYYIEGIMIVDGAEYPIRGERSSESEHESESALFFRAFTSKDKRSYIEVKQEFEAESEDGAEETEVEYVYTVAENDRPVERMTVKYEKEANELELKMTIERGNVREELVFEDETEDGVRVIAVSGTLDGEPVAFRIYIRDGHYDYVFSDGGTVSDDRYDDDDDWYDDDRFDDDDD